MSDTAADFGLLPPDTDTALVGEFIIESGEYLEGAEAALLALESDPALVERARSAVAALGCSNVEIAAGALSEGHAAGAPYDVILVEGAVETLPQGLHAQLREEGRLAVVEGVGNTGVARLYLRTGGSVTSRRAFNAAVKPLPGFERTPAFEF